jgi:hypothetical protein
MCPGVPQNLVQQTQVRSGVRDEHDPIGGQGGHNLIQLVEDAAALAGQAANVHHDDVGDREQRMKHRLPGVVQAMDLVDAEPAVGVAPHVEVGYAARHLAR